MNKKINKKKLILLAGGSGKLGEYLIDNLKYDQEKFKIIVLDIKEIPLKKIKGKEIEFINCDITNDLNLDEKLESLCIAYQHITILNLIGYDFPVNSKVKSINSPISITKEQLSKSLELNIASCHRLSQATLNLKIPFHLIFMSSIYSSKPTKSELYQKDQYGRNTYKPFIYGSSKAAIEKLAKDLSTFLPNINGRINVLSLGGVNLDLPEEFITRYANWSPQKCMVSPNSVLRILSWLIISSPYELNGCILKLDSGLSNT